MPPGVRICPGPGGFGPGGLSLRQIRAGGKISPVETMKKSPFFPILLLALVALPARGGGRRVPGRCRLYGKIQIVEAFGDVKVQVVEAFPDIRVQRVEAFPDGPGKWQIVDAFPDWKVEIVDAFPDYKIQWVDAFPGCR